MAEITLLDGGMGQELLRRSGDAPTHQWSVRIMRDHPQLVADVHADYFAAGADIATANTYALHRDRLAGTDLEDQFETLFDRALHAAESARAAHGGGLIAGSLGPLCGSYRPDAHPDLAVATPRYTECALLMKGRVDIVICETVASLAHARAALRGAQAAEEIGRAHV
jgi:S-methylmethionine-dependent homocysteine/selenocysteine methylase